MGSLPQCRYSLSGRTVTITVSPDMSVRDVMEKIYKKENVPIDQQRLVYAGRMLACDRSLSSYHIQKESTLHLISVLKGGKPVIYLFPPRPFSDVTVSVRLAPQWSFSHIYPLMQVKALANDMQSISWSVSAGKDGTLVDKRTNVDLSYLFWEALSRPTTIPLDPPLKPFVIDSHAPTEEHFDPSHPSLQPDSSTAVMLPFSQLLQYLDTVLKDLTLHTSARNDFITYWLPALSKHPFVALRFLPQSVYERAAELEVFPAPDVITRIFMLFRGVAAEEVKEWEEARERVGKVDWRSVVGISVGALSDMERFRVLEWGGMEVL
ncbi:ubiquitin-domain-containing protein [Fomes fomentarius]|nr:ubiquitin-domain-containing protein [Fomes fomentarius]